MTMLTAPMPDRVLTDYPAEGDRWQWNRVQRTLENEQLFRGDFTPLLNGRVAARNGLAQVLVHSDYIFSNWFKRRMTEFDLDAIVSERPGVSSTSPAREAFLDRPTAAAFRKYGVYGRCLVSPVSRAGTLQFRLRRRAGCGPSPRKTFSR